jgi:hypothetical protein
VVELVIILVVMLAEVLAVMLAEVLAEVPVMMLLLVVVASELSNTGPKRCTIDCILVARLVIAFSIA